MEFLVLTTKAGKSLRAFICECYSFGGAEYFETIQSLGKMDVIVINSDWCGYTTEAERQLAATRSACSRYAT